MLRLSQSVYFGDCQHLAEMESLFKLFLDERFLPLAVIGSMVI
jgi:hypothetical protein